MKTSRQTQGGAVTLIAALFILVVLSVMAVTLLRMSGSNLLDSAAHNDAVEALFIVETGIELPPSAMLKVMTATHCRVSGLSTLPAAVFHCSTRQHSQAMCAGFASPPVQDRQPIARPCARSMQTCDSVKIQRAVIP